MEFHRWNSTRGILPVEFYPWNSTGGSVGLLGDCHRLATIMCHNSCQDYLIRSISFSHIYCKNYYSILQTLACFLSLLILNFSIKFLNIGVKLMYTSFFHAVCDRQPLFDSDNYPPRTSLYLAFSVKRNETTKMESAF